MMLFVDSNVIIYSIDGREPRKQHQCREWLRLLAQRRILMISPQVCAETRNAGAKKLRISPDAIAKIVRGLLPWCQAPLTAAEVSAALDLAHRWNLSWWDALLLASAQASKCTHFLSEDSQTAPVIDGLRFVDPFKTAPDEILGAT